MSSKNDLKIHFRKNKIIIAYIHHNIKTYIPQDIIIIISKYYGFSFIKYNKGNIDTFIDCFPINMYKNGEVMYMINKNGNLYTFEPKRFGKNVWILRPFFNNKTIKLISKSHTSRDAFILTNNHKIYSFEIGSDINGTNPQLIQLPN